MSALLQAAGEQGRELGQRRPQPGRLDREPGLRPKHGAGQPRAGPSRAERDAERGQIGGHEAGRAHKLR